ncbi:MAG: aspartyl/asparaginyl beta-hydroxylase domain-containing protein [Candidatus Obscuribacterales bacterium]
MVYRDDRRYISQLFRVESAVVEAIEDEIADCSIDWYEPYSEHASPGLKVAILMSPEGHETDFSFGDSPGASVAPLMDSLPATMEFVEGLGFKVACARLLRLDPGAFVFEHMDHDNTYCRPGTGRLRLHLPIVTTQDAAVVLPGRRIHLKKGHLWKLSPSQTIHAAYNFSRAPRLHLMFDCFLNDRLGKFVENEYLDLDCQFELGPLTPPARQALMEAAGRALAQGRLRDAELILLSSFCKYDLGSLSSYDLLLDFINRTPALASRRQYWQDRLQEVYPAQFNPVTLAVV